MRSLEGVAQAQTSQLRDLSTEAHALRMEVHVLRARVEILEAEVRQHECLSEGHGRVRRSFVWVCVCVCVCVRHARRSKVFTDTTCHTLARHADHTPPTPGLTSLPWSVPEAWLAPALAVGNALLGLGGVLTERHPVADPLALVLAREGLAALVLLAPSSVARPPAAATCSRAPRGHQRALRARGARRRRGPRHRLAERAAAADGRARGGGGREEGAAVSVPGLLLATAGCPSPPRPRRCPSMRPCCCRPRAAPPSSS